MMHQSINKHKIYFYLLILLFSSTIFNFNTVSKFNDLNLIKSIDIEGLNPKEEFYLRDKLNIFKDSNIFSIKKENIEETLKIFNFLDYFSIKKIFPSKLIISTKKTNFLASSIVDGKEYYIGENGKLTLSSEVTDEKNLPLVFGKFSVEEFLNLQKIISKENIDLNKIKKYFYYQSLRWDIEDENGLVLKLPYGNVENSLKIYKKLIDNNIITSIKIIDFRIKNNLILTHDKK